MNKTASRIPWYFLVLLLAEGLILGDFLWLIPLNDDAGFFLPHASLILDGLLPYRDFFTWHSPWGPLLLAPLTWLSPEHLLEGFSWYMVGWNLVSAGMIYLISRRQQQSPWVSLVLSGWFLGMAIPAAGYYVTLEPLYLPFLLGSYLVITGEHRRKWMIAGLLFGIAFCIKQFALIAGVVFLFISIRKYSWRAYISGAFLPVLLSLSALIFAGVSWEAIWNNWLSPESPGAYFSSPGNIILILIILFPIITLGIGSFTNDVKDLWPRIGIIIAFAGLWALAGNHQYLLPAIGFVAITHSNSLKRPYLLISLLLVAIGSGLLTIGALSGLTRETQLAKAEETMNMVPEKESFLIMGWSGQYVYALIPQKPPSLASSGYQVFPLMTNPQQDAATNEADVIMVLDCDRSDDPDSTSFELVLSQDRGCRRWYRRKASMR